MSKILKRFISNPAFAKPEGNIDTIIRQPNDNRAQNFIDGKPTDAFKRKSKFYTLTFRSDGSATYEPSPDLTKNALRKLRKRNSIAALNSAPPALK